MAQDLGEVVIGLEPDEAQTTRVWDKASKGAASKFVREIDRGIRRLVSNAAAAFGGARGRGAAGLILTGIPPLGGAAKGAGAAGAVRGAGAAGAAGIAAVGVVVVVAAITGAVRALNKNTMAQVRNLSSVSPVLARVQAEGGVQNIRGRIITARLFEGAIASTARTLQLAKGELFKVKLVLTGVKVVFADVASKIALGAVKFLSFLIIDLPLAFTKLLNSVKIGVFTLLAGLADFLIPGAVGDSLAAALHMMARLMKTQNELVDKIKKTLDDLLKKSSAAEINDIMLQEIRRMAGLPVNPSNSPYLPDFDPYGSVPR